MSTIIEIIRTIRNIRSEYNVEPGRKISAYIAAGEHYALLTKYKEIFVGLARLDNDQLQVIETMSAKPEQAIGQVISGGIEIYLPLAGLIDLVAERTRLEKEVVNLEKRIAGSRGKLNNAGFVEKAPATVVEKERDRLADFEMQLGKLQEQLQALG